MNDPYDLAPDVIAPTLPGRVVLRESTEETLDAAASELFTHAIDCVRTFGDFHLALSVSTSLEGLFRRLMVDPKFRSLPWNRTHLWLACERVGSEAGECGRELRELVVDHSGIPAEQTHIIPLDAEEVASSYERDLRETLEWREPGHDRLDGVVLGLDDPITGAGPCESESLVVAGDDAVVRLSRRMINASRLISVVGLGGGAVEPLREHRSSARPFGLAPIGGALCWYLDHEACGRDSR